MKTTHALLALLFISLVLGTQAGSCATGKWACIASCKTQGYPTGKCVPDTKDGICTCTGKQGEGPCWPYGSK